MLFHIKITWSRRDFIKIPAIIAPEYTLRQANFVTLVEFPINCCLDVPSIDTLHKDQCKETSIIHLIFPAGGLTLCHEHKYKQLSHNCSPHFKKIQLNYAVKNSKQIGFAYGIRFDGRETCPIVENRLWQNQGQGSSEESEIKIS